MDIVDRTQDDSEAAMEIIDIDNDDSPPPSSRFSASRFQVFGAHSEPRPPSRSSGLESSSSCPMGHQNSTPSKAKGVTDPAMRNDTVSSSLSSDSPLTPSSSSLPFRNTPVPSKRPTMPDSQASKPPDATALQTPLKMDWTVPKLKRALADLTKDIDRNHAKLVQYSLKTATSQKPPERRHLSSSADLAGLKLPILGSEAKQAETMKVQFKLHRDKDSSRTNAGKKKMAYGVTCIKSDKERVPRYRFHHIEISRNILSPNTTLKFIPHLRDMKENEEERYRRWINELETMDEQSGFNATSSNRAEKAMKMLKDETAIEISLYIDRWVKKLGLRNCSKSILVRYLAEQSENNKMTPQQKNSIMNRHGDDVLSPQAVKAVRMFTDAFNNMWEHTELTLEDVLVHDEAESTVVENKKLVKDGKSEIEKPGVEQLIKAVRDNLETYTLLGCLYCYAHSCEHGYHDTNNRRAAVGAELIGGFSRLMRQNMADYLANPQPARETVPCKNKCYLEYREGNPHHDVAPWSDEELLILRGLYVALAATDLHLPCLVSSLGSRFCWEVYREIRRRGLDDRKPVQKLAQIEPPPPKMKALPWYDRRRKELKQDWQEHLLVHDFSHREINGPCNHEGPCGKDCICVANKLLCDRFCRCTVENCVYKFTGCACNSNGKTCMQQKKEGRPCICVQLNRECDPVLCIGCGALDRADPKNAHDTELHATGCQNVALQGNVSKAVLLGESQIPGCGYGLFAAEDIAQDEFVIEYLGELISHDEGVRREARRGDVFDEGSHSSYLFTLLDQEGIWVDAAIYGNLSRYINHASEADKVGRKQVNIVPQILHVNGDFRIKFKALRDIKTGEELFFNYGEYFPNLTKKLLDAKDGEATPKRGPRGGNSGSRVNRGGRGRGGRGRGRGNVKYNAATKKAPVVPTTFDDDVNILDNTAYEEPDDQEDDDFNPAGRLKAKRGGAAVSVRGIRKRKREASALKEDSIGSTESPPPQAGGSRSAGAKTRSLGAPLRGTRGGTRSGRVGKRSTDSESARTTAIFALDEEATSSTATAVQEPSQPHAILGTPSSRAAGRAKRRRYNKEEDGVDSDFKHATSRSGAGQHSPSLRRRTRNFPESDADDDAVGTPVRWDRSDEGSFDDSSPLDRSQRKRQRPARYRDSEE